MGRINTRDKNEKILRLAIVICTCLTGMNSILVKANNRKNEIIQVRNAEGVKINTEATLWETLAYGGGGTGSSEAVAAYGWACAGVVTTAGGAAIVAKVASSSGSSTAATNDSAGDTTTKSIEDVYNNPAIKKEMDTYKWSKSDMSFWLSKMIDTSLTHFLKTRILKFILAHQMIQMRNIMITEILQIISIHSMLMVHYGIT